MVTVTDELVVISYVLPRNLNVSKFFQTCWLNSEYLISAGSFTHKKTQTRTHTHKPCTPSFEQNSSR